MCLMNQSLGMHGTNVTPGMTAAMTRNEHISALLALQFPLYRVDDMLNLFWRIYVEQLDVASPLFYFSCLPQMAECVDFVNNNQLE